MDAGYDQNITQLKKKKLAEHFQKYPKFILLDDSKTAY